MEIYEKIKTLRKQNGLTLEQVGDFVGVGKSTVRKWENGIIENMRRDKIAKLAAVLGTTPDYLMGWSEETNETPDFTHDNILPLHTKHLPLLGDIACGEPIYAEEQYGEFVDVSSDIRADFCLRAKGDSMTGARIFDGDIVFIRKQEVVDNGQIAAVIIGDEATLKRVFFYPESRKMILNPENPSFEPIILVGDELDTVRVLGRAVAFQSKVR